MGVLDDSDEDEDFLDIGWKSDYEIAEEVLERFRFDVLEPALVDRVRQALDEEGVSYLRVIGEYDLDLGSGVLRVVLEDGVEVSIP